VDRESHDVQDDGVVGIRDHESLYSEITISAYAGPGKARYRGAGG